MGPLGARIGSRRSGPEPDCGCRLQRGKLIQLDWAVPTNPPPDGALLTAGNVGARLGALGQRVPVIATGDFVKASDDWHAGKRLSGEK
ncbi:MAG TPA: hypothetical protein VNU68_03685 [Verrucomicrobiae bacterium]|nr:hypothetical protein [Verrucomicrobiae bacterium]